MGNQNTKGNKSKDNPDGLSDKKSANKLTFVVRANVCLSHQYWSPAEHTAAITSAWSAPLLAGGHVHLAAGRSLPRTRPRGSHASLQVLGEPAGV